MTKNADFLPLFKVTISTQVGFHAESVAGNLVPRSVKLIIDSKLTLYGMTQSMVTFVTKKNKSSGFAEGCLSAIERQVESSSFIFSSKGASLTPGSGAVLEPPRRREVIIRLGGFLWVR